MSFRERITENPQNLPPCRPGHRSRPRTRAVSGNTAITTPVSRRCRSRMADEGECRHRLPGECAVSVSAATATDRARLKGMKHASARCPATPRWADSQNVETTTHAIMPTGGVSRRQDAETAMRSRSGYRRPARHERGSQSWWRCRRGPSSRERPIAPSATRLNVRERRMGLGRWREPSLLPRGGCLKEGQPSFMGRA